MFNKDKDNKLFLNNEMDLRDINFDVEDHSSFMVDLSKDGFELDLSRPGYSDDEEIQVEFQEHEVIDLINGVLVKNPKLVVGLVNYQADAISAIGEAIQKCTGYDINFNEWYAEKDFIRDFIDLVASGVLVSKNYINTIPCATKIFYADSNMLKNIYVVNTSHGKTWKGIPIIDNFSESTFNSVFEKFHGKGFRSCKISNFYNHFISKARISNVEEVFDDFDKMSNVEIAVGILEDAGFFDKFNKSKVKEARKNKIRLLVKTIKD